MRSCDLTRHTIHVGAFVKVVELTKCMYAFAVNYMIILLVSCDPLPPCVDVMIMVDNKSLAQLERESAEAERNVEEARQLALQLKRKVAFARSANESP